MSNSTLIPSNTTALVFGASGEQGRAVVEGLVDRGYRQVFAGTRETRDTYLTDGLGATLLTCDVQNPIDLRRAFTTTQATAIFLVTTTELPTAIGQTSGFSDAAAAEYQVIVEFFHVLKEVYQEDRLPRHVVLSTRDNVQRVTRELVEATGEVWIDPLDDGSVVPHYSAKGQGGEYALSYLRDTPELRLTLITLPFLYSNFLGFFAPLPNEGRTQWTLTACLGDGSSKVDMMGAADLATIVPNIFANPDLYKGLNIRLVGEQISMDEIAASFSDLFGKDVIYNPLTVAEVAALPFATAPAMAQMCAFLGDPRSLRHDPAASKRLMFPKHAQTFQDWLLTHSDSTAFAQVGLDYDAEDIAFVTVFGATSAEGSSVVKGLLSDARKSYRVRATTRHLDSQAAAALQDLDPGRVELAFADLDDVASCRAALAGGVQGVFLVTDFWQEANRDTETEERHAKNVIDACEGCSSVRHLVLSTKASVEELSQGLRGLVTASGNNPFDAKARAAAYARTKRLSVTYVLMPCYSEVFFDRIEKRSSSNGEKLVLTLPLRDDTKVMCMSIDDLGPAVANIFDSYQVYAGHEIGLVTDFVTVKEVRDIIDDVFMQSEDAATKLETEEVKAEEWLVAKDTYMKDLGQMFAYMSHSEAVKNRHSIAKTLRLVPSARPLRKWVEQNVDNAAFREKLGLR